MYLSYRRETALQGGLIMAKSKTVNGRQYFTDIRPIGSVFNHYDVIGQQNNRIWRENAK